MRQLIGQIHLWLGLALCAPIVLIGLTGTILVFQDELRGLFAPRAELGEPRTIGEIIAAAQSVAPAGFLPASYAAPQVPGLLATVRLSPPSRMTRPPTKACCGSCSTAANSW